MTINAQQVLDQIKEIPAMPNVIVKALGIIKDDQSGTKEPFHKLIPKIPVKYMTPA